MLTRPEGETRVVMKRWSVVDVSSSLTSETTSHLVGVVDGIGRVSSPIQWFYHDRMEAVTQSGKIYELHGEPGSNVDADWTFESWCRMHGINYAIDVTEEYWTHE